METKKPIKRNVAMVEFSKDHHFALLLVWKIREGLKKSIDPSRIIKYVIHFFEVDLFQHFADEESILFCQLPADNPLRLQAEYEHKTIRQLIENLKTNSSDGVQIALFANTLEKHIRFEERELFNYIQSTLTEEKLGELASTMSSREHNADISWEDMFWKIQ